MCVFITAVPLITLFAWGEGESGGHVLRETTSRGRAGVLLSLLLCVFTTAGPSDDTPFIVLTETKFSTKLFAWGWDVCVFITAERVCVVYWYSIQ